MRWAAVGLAATLMASAAQAQISRDSSAPIDITADESEVINSQCVTIWRGEAEALQENTRLRASVIKVYATPRPGTGENGQARCGDTNRLEAEGPVYYVTPNQTVRGDRAVYTAAEDTVVVSGDVIVVQGKNVARGSRLTLNNKTGEAKMESTVTGRNKPGRVRGVFYPDSKPAPGGAQ